MVEKERGTIATLLVTPMKRGQLAMGKIISLGIIGLLSGISSFVGTSWYVTITDAQGNAKALSFSFDGDSSTTAIENVAGQEDATVQTDEFVYNLSGQRVGTRNNMSNLSSGIYVVAGKKFVVK